LSSLGTGNGVDWIDAPATGVLSVATADANVITIGGTASNPTIDANTAAVTATSDNLATGAQIQTAINSALAGAVTFKGTFNANTGQITGGSDYLYNPGANSNTIAVAVGDMYVVSVAGNFFGNSSTALNVGDEVIAVTQSTIGPSNSQESYYNAVPSAGGGITGGGTTNKVPLWTGTTVLGDSAIAQSGTNIGIGTTSPAVTLEVNKGSEGEYLRVGGDNANNARSLRFTSSTSSTNSVGALHTIKANSTGGEIAFANGDGNIMYLQDGGNVGIGTTSPSAPLHVVGESLFEGRLQISSSTPEILFSVHSGGLDSRIHNDGSGNFIFGTGTNSSTPTERMRIDSSGRVGIGTTAPSVSLDVDATDAIQVPAGTTAQRPTAANGMLRYSTTDNQFEGYADGAWGAIAGGGGGGTKTVATVASVGAGVSTHALGVTVTITPNPEYYVDLYISGVYQSKTSYTVSGSTLTLTGATFPTGALIETVTTT